MLAGCGSWALASHPAPPYRQNTNKEKPGTTSDGPAPVVLHRQSRGNFYRHRPLPNSRMLALRSRPGYSGLACIVRMNSVPSPRRTRVFRREHCTTLRTALSGFRCETPTTAKTSVNQFRAHHIVVRGSTHGCCGTGNCIGAPVHFRRHGVMDPGVGGIASNHTERKLLLRATRAIATVKDKGQFRRAGASGSGGCQHVPVSATPLVRAQPGAIQLCEEL